MSPKKSLSFFDFEEATGLVWLSKPESVLNASERLAIEEAKRFKADAVYFRRKEDQGVSVPQVYIYIKDFSSDDLNELHKNLWSSGIVPLFYVVTSTEVKIFNCSKSLEKRGSKKVEIAPEPFKIFSTVGDIQQQVDQERFSAKLFDNGVFWDAHPQILKVSESPYQKLLDGLLNAKKDLEKKNLPIAPSTISKLLIMGVLVKYLEEKEDINGTKLLAISRDFYNRFPSCEQFSDILKQGQIIPFLDLLNQKFNGKIFDLKEEEKEELKSADLTYLGHVFDADIEGNQFVLWKSYAFNFLPIELISGIYEAFLKKEKGVVYTPPYLVNLLIDECMPLDKAEEMFADGSFKILDPACGSGIFLVSALKRMVQWQAILNFNATGKVEYPDIETVKKIVKNNVFGVDIEQGATLISIFSLSIAVCDKLSPMEIWNNLKFDDLGENNIRTANFFGVFEDLKTQPFDLVIGNPPFNPPSGFSNKSYRLSIKKEFGIQPSTPLNDDHLALFFWDKAVELRRVGGKICFLLPSGAFLYNSNAAGYRSAFLEKYQVEKIYDFTLLSDKLFKKRDNEGKKKDVGIAVCAVVATDFENEKPHDLLHIIVKRSRVSEELFAFEIDHYDFHKVRHKTALENAFVWKCNLWGGGRLVKLVSYLGRLRSLGEFLDERKKEHEWEFGEGYIIGHKGRDIQDETFIKHGRRRKFHSDVDWITGKETVEELKETGELIVKTEWEQLFEWPRDKTKKIFTPPHILVKKSLGKTRIPAVYSEKYLCFKDRITGIHAPEKDALILRNLFNSLSNNNSIHRAYALSTSGESGVTMSVYLLGMADILNLPFPENQEDLELGDLEKIVQDDVLNFYIKSGDNSKKSPLNADAQPADLAAFGAAFCKTMNPIYEQNGMKWFVRGHEKTESATAFVFCFGKPATDALPDFFKNGMDGIEKLLFNSTRRNLRISRVLREYLHFDGYDILVLVKPNALRYWLQSVALRDADETFSDLKINGF